MENPEDQFPVCIRLALQWGDMDAFNHINNAIYLRYFENARIRLLEDTAVMSLMEAEGVGPILARIDARYLFPLTYPDHIRAYARIKSIGNTSFVVEHLVWSETHDRPACRGDGVVVMYDYKRDKKVAISDALRKKLEELL